MARGLALTTAALATFTAFVLAGALTRVDDWGIDHVMPALDPRGTPGGIVDRNGLWRPFPLDVNWWNKLLDTYNYPASILPLGIIVVIATIVLLRRGQRAPAVVWLWAWGLVDVLELLGKHGLALPRLPRRAVVGRQRPDPRRHVRQLVPERPHRPVGRAGRDGRVRLAATSMGRGGVAPARARCSRRLGRTRDLGRRRRLAARP